MPKPPVSQTRGRSAEQAAARFLQSRGLRLRQQNYRCRLGEIDLVMLEGSTLVFVEVRYRADGRYGSGAESVGPRKQRKLLKAAEHYLQAQGGAIPDCRFDVVQLSDSAPGIEWIQDAFQAQP